MMFFRKRIVPPTPPSLVKLYRSALSLMSGPAISTPISDQVPELMYAQESPWAGTAATAEPVSCDAGAITGTASSPVSGRQTGRSGPSTVPGSDDRAEDVRRQAKGLQQPGRPAFRRRDRTSGWCWRR